MKVTAIIPAWNNPRETQACVASILKSRFSKRELEVLVVDNGSDKPLKITGCRILRLEENRGYAGGINAGIKVSKSKYLWILNNDVMVSQEALPKLMGKIGRYAGVGPTILDFGRPKVQKTWAEIDKNTLELVNRKEQKSRAVEAVAFCAGLFRREVFAKIGGVDESYFHYFEDNDFFVRCQRAGLKFWYESSARVWHKSQTSMKGDRQIYYLNRNRLVLLSKFAKVSHWANFKFFVSCQNRVTRRAISDFYLHRWGKQV